MEAFPCDALKSGEPEKILAEVYEKFQPGSINGQNSYFFSVMFLADLLLTVV